MNAAVYLAGGAQLISKEPLACVMKLRPAKHTDDANPATTFRLMQTQVTHKNTYACLRADWDEMMHSCNEINVGIRRDRAVGASFAGAIPTAFMIEGVDDLVPLSKLLVYHLTLRHVRDSHTDEQTRAAFADLVQMCASAISGGYVIRKAEDPTKLEPELGCLVQSRSKKSWKWDALPADCITFIYAGAQRKTDLKPWDLLTLFKIL